MTERSNGVRHEMTGQERRELFHESVGIVMKNLTDGLITGAESDVLLNCLVSKYIGRDIADANVTHLDPQGLLEIADRESGS